MKSIARRTFIGQSALVAGAGIISSSFKTTPHMAENTFIHHVYFWLKNPGNAEDTGKLIVGLKKLSNVKTILSFHIGKPADTNRDVIDRSYAVFWCVFFKNATDQASYQADPIHLRFVEECSPLWTRVIVYDSIDV